VQKEVGLKFRMDAGEAMLGDVEPDDFEFGFEELHFVKEKTFSATDIENARTGFEAVSVDEGLGNRLPSPGKVFVAAIAETAVAIPVIEFVFLGLEHAGDLVVDHACEDIAGSGFMEWGDEVAELGHERRVKVKVKVRVKVNKFLFPTPFTLTFILPFLLREAHRCGRVPVDWKEDGRDRRAGLAERGSGRYRPT